MPDKSQFLSLKLKLEMQDGWIKIHIKMSTRLLFTIIAATRVGVEILSRYPQIAAIIQAVTARIEQP